MLQALTNFGPEIRTAAELEKGKESALTTCTNHTLHQRQGSPEAGNCQKTFFSREHIMMLHLEGYPVIYTIKT